MNRKMKMNNKRKQKKRKRNRKKKKKKKKTKTKMFKTQIRTSLLVMNPKSMILLEKKKEKKLLCRTNPLNPRAGLIKKNKKLIKNHLTNLSFSRYIRRQDHCRRFLKSCLCHRQRHRNPDRRGYLMILQTTHKCL